MLYGLPRCEPRLKILAHWMGVSTPHGVRRRFHYFASASQPDRVELSLPAALLEEDERLAGAEWQHVGLREASHVGGDRVRMRLLVGTAAAMEAAVAVQPAQKWMAAAEKVEAAMAEANARGGTAE